MKNLTFLFLIAVSTAAAGTGSLYSRYGVGDVNAFLSGKNIGMGNAGIALFGETHINLSNPASIANITRSILSASYQYRSFASQDDFGSSVVASGGINSFALAFPVLERKKMVFSLGLLPFTTVGYELRKEQVVGGNASVQSYEGRGGINSAQASLSYAVSSDVMVGATAHYLFGSIYRDQTITFLTGNLFGATYNETSSYSGLGLTVGGIYAGIDKALGLSETKSVNIAATLFTGSSLDLDREVLRNFYSSQDTAAQQDRSVSLPFGFTAGIAMLSNRTVYAADMQFQNWGGFTVDGVHPAELQNSLRLGIGAEFLPQSDFVGDEFLKRISYRVGAYALRSNLELMGNSINEIGGTAGMTFPMNPETRVHLALEYGLRGTTSSNLVRDAIVRFTVSVSASELMFIQPPID
ncbi:MAG: hypothetical protein HUU02_09840 [Bacteroidetes bacterium]|nr:hypothetical protein [Bacteroidota bacterium]